MREAIPRGITTYACIGFWVSQTVGRDRELLSSVYQFYVRYHRDEFPI
jgi:hypothetical protein